MSRNKTRSPGGDPACSEHSAYEIGYCKPPLNTRWSPGVSGNLQGRPKSSLNLKKIASLLAEELDEYVSVQGPDGKRRLSKQRAYLKKLINDALTGGARDKKLLFDAMVRLAASDAADESATDKAVLEGDDVLERYVDRAIRRRELANEALEEDEGDGSP